MPQQPTADITDIQGQHISPSQPSPEKPLYPRLLSADWDALDDRLKHFHWITGTRHGSGLFEISCGRAGLARFLAWLLRLPHEGRDVPTTLVIRCEHIPNREIGAAERWERTFGSRKLYSLQYASRQKFLAERFGMLELRFLLDVCDHALLFHPVGAAIAIGPLRLRLPPPLSPQIHARVAGLEGSASRLGVSVSVAAPWIGSVLSYEGYLEPQDLDGREDETLTRGSDTQS
jgi:Domain of unknown function (DUF4166)